MSMFLKMVSFGQLGKKKKKKKGPSQAEQDAEAFLEQQKLDERAGELAAVRRRKAGERQRPGSLLGGA